MTFRNESILQKVCRWMGCISLSASICVVGSVLQAQEYEAASPSVLPEGAYSPLPAFGQANGAIQPLPPSVEQSAFNAFEGKDIDFTGMSERIKALEKAQKAESDAAKKKKADDALKPTWKIAARIHTDFVAFPDVDPAVGLLEDADGSPNDRVLFRRVRLGVGGEIPDNMVYKLDIDFNQPQTPQFKDVYFGWTELPLLHTVLVGMQKRPYGLDHLNSSNANIFMERPVVIEAFNQDARRWGITSNGVSENERFNWRYGGFMSRDLQTLGTDLTSLNESYQAEFAGRMASTFWYDEASGGRYYGHAAVAGRWGNADGLDPASNVANFQSRPEIRTNDRWINTGAIAGADGYGLLAFENLINWGSLSVTSEYQTSSVSRGALSDLQFWGAYTQIGWVVTGEHHGWDRKTGTLKPLQPFENFWIVDRARGGRSAGWGALEVAARFSYADFTDGPIYGGESAIATLGLQWFWNANCRMQANYLIGNMDQRFNNNNLAQPRNGDYEVAGIRWIFFM